MAANDLTKIIPQLLAQGLMALREYAIMPQLVNRAYESMAGAEGSTIDVPIPSAIAAVAVTPGATPPATEGVTPTSVAIALDQWFEAPFQLSDKDQLEIARGSLPMIASEAIKSLANNVDKFLLGKFAMFYGFVGTAGVTPFGSGVEVKSSTLLRKVLNEQLAPLDPRYCVVDPTAEAEALSLRAFHDASFGVGASAIMEGQINRRLGFGWFMDQNVMTHVAGTGANYLVNGAHGVGAKTILLSTGTGTHTAGDIVTFAGDAQTYVVTAAKTTGAGNLLIEPGLVIALSGSEAVLSAGDTGGVGDHVMNAGFHRDAIAFATRPLAGSSHPSSLIDTQVDPVSGLTLRLEVTREHKRDRFSFDILYGAEVIRRELGARLAG